MFSAPATTTRPITRSAQPGQPPRPRWQLAGRDVTQEQFYAVQKAKQAGHRVFFVLLTLHDDDLSVPPGDCPNCLGAGYLGLDVTMVGPMVDKPGDDKVLRPAFHSGSWWLVAREFFPCPRCNDRKVIEL